MALQIAFFVFKTQMYLKLICLIFFSFWGRSFLSLRLIVYVMLNVIYGISPGKFIHLAIIHYHLILFAIFYHVIPNIQYKGIFKPCRFAWQLCDLFCDAVYVLEKEIWYCRLINLFIGRHKKQNQLSQKLFIKPSLKKRNK